MTMTAPNHPGARQPLRVWPGVTAVILQWVLWLVVPAIAQGAMVYSVFGAIACGAVVLVWWLLFSRAPWLERLGALALMVVALLATSRVVHPSISNGMMGLMLWIYAVPALSLGLVAWAVAARPLAGVARYASMVVAFAIACGGFAIIRTGGITGEGSSDLHWRWTPTPEERLLARAAEAPLPPAAPATPPTELATSAPVAPPSAPTAPASPVAAAEPVVSQPLASDSPDALPPAPEAAAAEAAWPGFRGPARDGVVRHLHIATNWGESPPVELWRRAIGPGWSSLAVDGDLVYTQEQRGDDEVVSCYRLSTGEPVWAHRNEARFWESNGGAGPRATPTVHDGRVYTLGATGLVNVLDAATGALVWSRDAAADTGTDVPGWGFAGSPLVVGNVVIVALDGQLAGYDAASGERRWLGPPGGAGYSSPHLLTLGDVPQILLLRGSRTVSIAPADGTMLWEHLWERGAGFVQPALVPGGDLLLTVADAMGGIAMRRVGVAHDNGQWRIDERWTSRGLKPYFNDFVVHEGHAYGFDGSILAAIDLADGARKWKGGRYGHGQLVLFPDEDVLLVLSEDGQLVLVAASPDRFTEVARVPALEGKTWNHPALAGDVLLVRNGEEMAAFRLPRAGSAPPGHTR
jgi:outer membrane protein assembly factor BamB